VLQKIFLLSFSENHQHFRDARFFSLQEDGALETYHRFEIKLCLHFERGINISRGIVPPWRGCRFPLIFCNHN
jgi:hypothetical protein